ncbi:MAG: hypothetical protein HYW22_00240 [Candidatus Aenigmarchaeota archaeon]|nr:hypothetical protein [Candidatus Aenigmarchaeota archaeon]
MSAQHYVPKTVSQIDSKDFKVCLIGNVIATTGSSFILDDGTGRIEISTDRLLPKNKLVRAFCSMNEDRLQADVIQDVEGIDLNLFKKVNELYNTAGV